MSALKTVAGFAIVGVLLASGVKSERQFELEGDSVVRQMVEKSARQYAAGYDPKVSLTMPELKDFSMESISVTRSKAGAFLDSTLGDGDLSYDVYVQYREGGENRCLTLDLEWKAGSETWRVDHTGAYDRCTPVW
jgi:hypothetical protein